MKRTNTGRNAALALIAALALGGGYYLGTGGGRPGPAGPATPGTVSTAPHAQPSLGPNDSILPDRELQPQGPLHHAIAVYSVASSDDGAKLVKRTVKVDESAGDAAAAARAIDAMAEEERSPLPPGSRVKSVRFGSDGVATVDFNSAFQKNFPGGDENEALALNAVLATLGQFPGVKSVQFLVEGEKIDSLGGNESLTEPLLVPQGSGDDSQPPAVAKSEP